MTDDEIPEGQVPRDEAFWNTYRAVQEEERQRFRQADCLGDQRHRSLRLDPPVHCEHCGAGWGRLLADWSSWRAEERVGNRRPRPGDVLFEAGEVRWVDGGPRVIAEQVVVGDDDSYRIKFRPPDWPLPESFTFPGLDVHA